MSFFDKFIEHANTKFKNPNLLDRVLDKLFLWLFPSFVKPNHLTVLRYFMIPFTFYFLVSGRYFEGLILFSIASFTDALDGALARVRNQITDWGKTNDPIADKLLVGFSGAVLITRYISLELILVILSLEFLTILFVIKLESSNKQPEAILPGKIKMVCQSIGIIFLLFYLTFSSAVALKLATVLFYVSVFFGALNLAVYRPFKNN